MKELTPIEKLNLALSEHLVASGYEPMEKYDGEPPAGGKHAASAQQTLVARHGKPSSRLAFNNAHSASGSSGFKKPMAPKAPISPAKPNAG